MESLCIGSEQIFFGKRYVFDINVCVCVATRETTLHVSGDKVKSSGKEFFVIKNVSPHCNADFLTITCPRPTFTTMEEAAVFWPSPLSYKHHVPWCYKRYAQYEIKCSVTITYCPCPSCSLSLDLIQLQLEASSGTWITTLLEIIMNLLIKGALGFISLENKATVEDIGAHIVCVDDSLAWV